MRNAAPVPSVPRPAATVMLLRPRDAGSFDVYLTRRSARSRFMPDVYVFPGGAVDAADAGPDALARLRGAPPGIAAAFLVAALRELFEEAGVLIACDAAGDPVRFDARALDALRAELAGGAPVATLAAREAFDLDARGLVHYSNWVTPASEPIRFDAHFFAARAPDGQIAAADAVETHDGVWLEPQAALARAASGELGIMFPTQKHLERLARFATIDAFFEHARTRHVVAVEPFRHDDGTIEFPTQLAEW